MKREKRKKFGESEDGRRKTEVEKGNRNRSSLIREVHDE